MRLHDQVQKLSSCVCVCGGEHFSLPRVNRYQSVCGVRGVFAGPRRQPKSLGRNADEQCVQRASMLCGRRSSPMSSHVQIAPRDGRSGRKKQI